MPKFTSGHLERELEVRSYIENHADLFDIDPNLVRGLISQESRFTAEATSPTGAFGYGQFTGIGARQVQNISRMTEKAADLCNFVKTDASDPDKGIKAICATLWWLFNKKYHNEKDKQIQLEAVLTFYNSGGRTAALVIKYDGHRNALESLKALPRNMRSQSPTYAPEVAIWFVAWHEHMAKQAVIPVPEPVVNPFDEASEMNINHKTLIQVLQLFAENEANIDSLINIRDGLTEFTLVFPGELS